MDLPRPPKPDDVRVPAPPAVSRNEEKEPRYEEEAKHLTASLRSSGKNYPPLFIKLDKYSEVVRSVQKLKSSALTLRDALDALEDVEKELRNGLAITHKALDNFNTVVSLLDSKLLRVEHMDEPPQIGSKETDAATAEVNTYIKDVYDQIEKIKSELKAVGSEK